ncbi:DUF1667 domain-containing protein [Clostridium niameyense]|uniref:DUF1667 domain-containing protein n=1 Tax=Clostridium niameyense TaxID=1622073 RepID=A0A6M0R9K7_9CLOT|nr:DUF1667 domain-containing protein [Clostridium niameyense]NEZ46951.1 DUF1667 domain-containing protein [Clostridium niameyense]
MEIRELTCIGCPLGCGLEVKMDDSKVVEVTGNTCPRGKIYAEKECTNPTRILTISIKVENGEEDVVCVKTEKDIPKDKIIEAVEVLKSIEVKAPINIGDIVLENILGSGVNVIATKCLKAKN